MPQEVVDYCIKIYTPRQSIIDRFVPNIQLLVVFNNRGNMGPCERFRTSQGWWYPWVRNGMQMIYVNSVWLYGYFEPSSKRYKVVGMKALMGTLRKEVVVVVTCWELKSHLLKTLMLLAFTYNAKFEEVIWKTHIEKFSRRAWRCIYDYLLDAH